MKRLALIVLSLIAFSQAIWADYEYGPAQFVTIWDEEEQFFCCETS